MKLHLALLVSAILLLGGCANQSEQTANTALEPQKPWLCQGVDGKWQCQRGNAERQQPSTGIVDLPAAQRPLVPENKPTTSATRSTIDTSDVLPTEVVALDKSAQEPLQKTDRKIDTANEPDLWTIQWVALSSNAAAQQYGRNYLSGAVDDYEIRHIRVNNRDYYILFSGRYANKAAATEAADRIRATSAEPPFLRTVSSIAAVTVN